MFFKKNKRHRCLCCNNYTLIGSIEDIAWKICPVCYWENDVNEEDLDKYSHANKMTLREARENYQKFSACKSEYIDKVRKPKRNELHGEERTQ